MTQRSFLIILLFFLSIFSCNKDKWNEPTNVKFIVDINRSSGIGGKLAFTSGNIVLENFSFDGNRVQGDDVYFSNSYPTGLNINYNSNATVGELNYDIPQGTFTKIQIAFSTFGSTSDNHIIIEGTYNMGMNNNYPIRFEFKSKESFSVLSQNVSGASEIILKKDNPLTPKIIFDPIYWFLPISQNLLNSANVVDVNGTPTILINNSTNTEIFNIIASRIGEGVRVIF
ncbi:MAG: hypothetical protein A2X08_14380 [Bacteroidetes bacterium GWA2_32_17]|nr:MAG: hypothetical protein A2X08_14380 [Bacteroidetes bacterium GWA2_32_17]